MLLGLSASTSSNPAPQDQLWTPEHVLYFHRMRELESFLVSEYEDRKDDLARAHADSLSPDQLELAIERYLQSMRNLRKFLSHGEIPPGLTENFL